MCDANLLINLDRESKRLGHVRDQLGAMAFTRVAAVDGRKKPETIEGLDAVRTRLFGEPPRGMAPVSDSDRDACACFLEDDIHIRPGFAELIEDESWVPSDAHSVKIDTYLQVGEARRRSVRCWAAVLLRRSIHFTKAPQPTSSRGRARSATSN